MSGIIQDFLNLHILTKPWAFHNAKGVWQWMVFIWTGWTFGSNDHEVSVESSLCEGRGGARRCVKQADGWPDIVCDNGNISLLGRQHYAQGQ